MRSRGRWFAAVVALSTILCVGCFSFAVDYSSVTALLQPQSGAIAEIIQLLDQGKEADARELLDELHEAVVQTRAMLTGLRFEGTANTLVDPFTLPVGTYRVTARTEGALIVKAFPVDDPDDYALLFNLFMEEAADGAGTVYRSNGERIMLEFTNITAPYELWFEEIS